MKADGSILEATRRSDSRVAIPALLMFVLFLQAPARAPTNCEAGNGQLDSAPPKTRSAHEVIQKFGAAEAATKEARLHYTYKQDVLIETLVGTSVTGEFHEVTNISYDPKGRRQEEVTFAAQPSWRGIQLTPEDGESMWQERPGESASEETRAAGAPSDVRDLAPTGRRPLLVFRLDAIG